MFLAPETKYVWNIEIFGVLQEHMAFKDVNDSKQVLDCSHFCKMIEGKIISAMIPKTWKKSLNGGVVKPTKLRFCNECTDKRTCIRCNSQIKETKEFEVNLNELKRQPLNQFVHMLPYFKE